MLYFENQNDMPGFGPALASCIAHMSFPAAVLKGFLNALLHTAARPESDTTFVRLFIVCVSVLGLRMLHWPVRNAYWQVCWVLPCYFSLNS